MRPILSTIAVGGLLCVSMAAGALPNAAAEAATPTDFVDLEPPVFSHPTRITNPLFPIASVDQAVQLGAEGDVAIRHEITLLDRTRVIPWDGQDIEAVVSQFVAYGDGEIIETATDYFAQADDGSVWYLGEDVTNYENGRVANHDGTWLAGRDGPGGMIMPAHPHVGDVYRPENIPGLVYEEVTVKQTDLTVDGPSGPVHGAILVQENPAGGNLEDKVFAPGYGEFDASVPADSEVVNMAIAVPTDASPHGAPSALDRLTDTARTASTGGATLSWTRLASLAREARRAGGAVIAADPVPLLDGQVVDALDDLDAAVAARSRTRVRQAGIDLEQAALDTAMQYDDPDDIDEDRIEVWEIQRDLHRATGQPAGVRSDTVIISAIEERISP